MFDSTPPISPWSRFGVFVLIGGLVLVFAIWGVLNWLPAPRKPAVTGGTTAPVTPAASSQNANALAKPPAPKGADTAAVAEVTRTLDQALAVLRDSSNPDKTEALRAVRDALHRVEPTVALAAIRQFLTSGQDASTGQRFKVGEGGALEEAPTLRTFLMDELGSLSNEAHTADGAEVAREVLSAKNSADEWALAMRNLAWADPQGSKVELAAKARELMNYAPWQQAPSGGYLEAFDAAAYSGDATLIETLVPLGREKSPVQQAALVALDRLSAMAPAQVADYLNSHPDTLADRPLLRADYMGKVNLSDSGQKAQAETYLQRTDVSLEEKSKFLARLGMPAGFVSDNLLTPSEIVPMPLLERRALVNRTAGDWAASGKYPALQSALQTLITNTAPSAASLEP
jgi:hypothetical protein